MKGLNSKDFLLKIEIEQTVAIKIVITHFRNRMSEHHNSVYKQRVDGDTR